MKHLTNILPFLTILYGGIATILLGLNILPGIPELHILGLSAFTAATLLSERIFITSDIKNNISDIKTDLLRISASADVMTFATEDAGVNYINEKTKSATTSVWRASLDDQSKRNSSEVRDKYLKDREEKIFREEINYKYVTVLYKETGIDKLDRYNNYVNERKLKKFYGSFYVASPLHVPLVSFIIIDQNEVYTRSPVTTGNEDKYIVIRNKDLVKLFIKYYEDLFERGRSIKGEGYNELKNELIRTHETKSS